MKKALYYILPSILRGVYIQNDKPDNAFKAIPHLEKFKVRYLICLNIITNKTQYSKATPHRDCAVLPKDRRSYYSWLLGENSGLLEDK